MTFDEAIKAIKSNTHWCGIACDGDENCEMHGLMTYERVVEIVRELQEKYAPKIKMTSEQKEEFMAFVEQPHDKFENFWFAMGSGDSLYKNKISEEDLMRAWLHPELIDIEVMDNDFTN